MSREELRSGINELLDHTSDRVLQEVLEYLKSVNDRSAHGLGLSDNLRKIVSEDKELLERLAK